MKIDCIGRCSLFIQSDRMAFDRPPLPAVKWRLGEGGRRRGRTMLDIEKTDDAHELGLERLAEIC